MHILDILTLVMLLGGGCAVFLFFIIAGIWQLVKKVKKSKGEY
jgi:hypothetical protein